MSQIETSKSFTTIKNWQEHEESKLITQAFGSIAKRKDIMRIFGNSEREEFLYVGSNDRGTFDIYIKSPGREGRSVMINEDAWTSNPMMLSVTLHSELPLIYYLKDTVGDNNHSIIELNYEEKTERVIVENLGWTKALFIDGDQLIITISRKEDIMAAKVNIADGTVTTIFEDNIQILSYEFSLKQRKLILSAGRGSNNLIIIDVDRERIIHQIEESIESNDRFPSVNINQDKLTYITDVSGQEELVIVSLHTYEELNRTKVLGAGVGFFPLDMDYVQWKSEDEIAVIVTSDAESKPYIYSIPQNKWSEALSSFQVLSGLTLTKIGLIWPAGNGGTSNHVETYIDNKTKRLTQPAVESDQAKKEVHWFESKDGMKIQGWLRRNPNPTASLLILIHGGPSYVDMDIFDPKTAIMVSAGYHVFQPNYRGSTTFGVEYQKALAGNMGTEEVHDIIAATKYAKELLKLNSKAIIIGGSYGGYLSLMASLKAPELYAGCLAGAPIADLEMNWSLASAHYKEFLTHFLGGSLEEVPDRYRNASPLTHIDNMAVPTFISAGTNDTSTYFPQTENFCNVAKEKGKEIYTYFDDSGHDTSDKNMIILQITNTLLFLKYVTNK